LNAAGLSQLLIVLSLQFGLHPERELVDPDVGAAVAVREVLGVY
jgi:hypothetical protein